MKNIRFLTITLCALLACQARAGISLITDLKKDGKTITLIGCSEQTCQADNMLQTDVLVPMVARRPHVVFFYAGLSPFLSSQRARTEIEESIIDTLVPALGHSSFPHKNIEMRGPSLELADLSETIEDAVVIRMRKNRRVGKKITEFRTQRTAMQHLEYLGATPDAIARELRAQALSAIMFKEHSGADTVAAIGDRLTKILPDLDLCLHVLEEMDSTEDLSRLSRRDKEGFTALTKNIGDVGDELFEIYALYEILEASAQNVCVLVNTNNADRISTTLRHVGFDLARITVTEAGAQILTPDAIRRHFAD